MSDLSKTIRYLKRNGIKSTYYAALERLLQRGVPYEYAEIDDEEADLQRSIFSGNRPFPVLFSILVPVYETKEVYLRAMIESCLTQTYSHFELILADASVSDGPEQCIKSYSDDRIKYIKLIDNKGISENTNAALSAATGHYCVLLDHDDLLTKDALFEAVCAIEEGRENGINVKFVYSDEDKCDGEGRHFSDPHYKKDINLDLLMSNNYICHMSVLETALIKSLKFRGEYNGSQDHDLFLRAVGRILFNGEQFDYSRKEQIVHIKKVLYHWRCHEESTASNPASKEYAYKAGKKAVKDFARTYFGDIKVFGARHKGFYDVKWGENIFELRPDVGAVGGPYIKNNKVVHGILERDGSDEFAGLNKHFSGYMHRASLIQEAYALDIRTIKPAPCLKEVYDDLMELCEDADEEEIKLISINFAKKAHKMGRILLYMPIVK